MIGRRVVNNIMGVKPTVPKKRKVVKKKMPLKDRKSKNSNGKIYTVYVLDPYESLSNDVYYDGSSFRTKQEAERYVEKTYGPDDDVQIVEEDV